MLIERHAGLATDFITTAFPEPFVDLTAQVYDLYRPALVLGSAQPESSANLQRCASEGVNVVRRRSGGGAVFLTPRRSIWVDVLVPRTHRRWSDDIRKSSQWLGEVWLRALTQLGAEAEIFEGALQNTDWGRLVCFGSLGPGEVVIDGRKLVGIAQRRSRVGARLQCLVLDDWVPGDIVDRLLMPADQALRARRELADLALGSPVPVSELERTFLEQLALAD